MAQIKVTARDALNELKRLEGEFKQFQEQTKNLGGNAANSLKSLDQRITSTRSLVENLGHRLNFLVAQLKQQQAQAQATSNANSRLSQSKKRVTQETEKNTRSVQKNTRETRNNTKANRNNTKSINNQAKANRSLANTLKTLIANFGIIGGLVVFKNILGEAFELIKTFDTLNLTMKLISETAFDLTDSQIFLADITERLGLDIVTTTNRYTKFLAAAQQSNISLQSTQRIFESVSKASSVLGLQTSELESVFLALEQIISKGRLSTEELRRQLGERLPGAFGIMAAALDVTVPKLDEMLRRGEVLSAEALPKFAEALEVAFSVENVERVNTLTAAQNRLTNSWQNFVQVVASGELNRALRSTLDFLADFFNTYAEFFANSQQKIQFIAVERTRVAQREFDAENRKLLDQQKQAGQRFNDLQAAVDKQRAVVQAQVANDDIKREQEKLDTLVAAQVRYNKELQVLAAARARDELSIVEETLKIQRQELEEDIKERDRLQDIRDRRADAPSEAGINIRRLEELENTIAASERNVGDLIAQVRVLRQAIDVVEPIEVTATTRGQDRIDTSDLDLLLARLKIRQELLDIIRNDELRNLEERQKANEEFAETSIRIEEVTAKKRIRLARGNNNLIIKANEQAAFEISRIQENTDDELIKIQLNTIQLGTERIRKEIEKRRDERIAETRKEFDALGALTKKQQRQLDTELGNIRREANNEAAQEQADFIKQQLDSLRIFGEERVKLERLIARLLASIQLESNKQETTRRRSFIREIIDLFHNFANSVGDIYDNLLQKRISVINAEIDAEQRKFDELIRLAEGDEAQQDALRQQSQRRREQLEARRLRIEQQQARFRKAIAIGEIAVQLGQTIVAHNLAAAQIDAATLGVGGAFYRAIEIPLSVALAAAQTAAVLAAPIPQFKDGVRDLNRNTTAMINDGGKQEFVERGDQILTTTTKNAIVDLQKHDTVYRDYDDMVRNSKVYKVTRPSDFKVIQLSPDHDVIRDAISDGFKKAKINNSIKIVNKSSNDSYRDSITKW